MAQSPEQVVQSFVEALNKKNLDGAAKLIRGGAVSPYLKSSVEKEGLLPTMKLTAVESAVVGDRAIVSFHLETTSPAGVPPMDDYLVLLKTPAGWLIDQPVRDDGLSLMAYFMSDPPLLRQAHAAAQATQCLSNIKQVGTAMLIFLADNDDVFKLSAANWKSKLAPYLKNASLLSCPLDPKGTTSYTFNANLAGKSHMSIDDFGHTVMVYEGNGGKLRFRHNGRAAVGFADGSARLVSEADAKALLWKTE